MIFDFEKMDVTACKEALEAKSAALAEERGYQVCEEVDETLRDRMLGILFDELEQMSYGEAGHGFEGMAHMAYRMGAITNTELIVLLMELGER